MQMISLFIVFAAFYFNIYQCNTSTEPIQLDVVNVTTTTPTTTTTITTTPATITTTILNKSETNEDIDDDYNDYVDENEVGKQIRQRNQSTLDRVGTFYTWDRWEKWSKCATNCVQIKKRKCIERIKNSTDETTVEKRFYPPLSSGKFSCSGVLKRYRQCKEERCKTGKQKLRDEQCEKFNTVPYRETFYNWIGYEKEHDECMLFCRATDSDLFISMNQSVTDGTPCNRPAVYYTQFYRRQAVCVEGICRAVHSSGSIRPVTTRDIQLKCGSVLCKHISELFNKTDLKSNYNHLTTIPIGAMNLSIKEQSKPNTNSLALKSPSEVFLLNGNLAKIADNGLFNFNEDEYEYNRSKGLLTSRGPLNKAVIITYFVSELNGTIDDIHCNYTLPISSASVIEEEELQAVWDEWGKPINVSDDGYTQRLRERKRRRYSWKLLGFGDCNRSCGPGTQTPIFRCVCTRESSLRYYSPKRCADMAKPTFNDDIYNCNRGVCPAFWRPSNFSNCQCLNGSLMGHRQRQFECMQEQIKGNVILVADDLCPVRDNITESCRCQTEVVKINNVTLTAN